LLVLSVIPVLPPELRPLLVLDGGRIVSSDLNDLYIRLLHRNRRLQRFVERGAPDIMLHHEHRLLQDACDALFDNAHRKHPLTNARGQTLKSLTDALQGKQGRFRRNLLGKRVDYSGRSVIVVGPELSLHECGLPKDMACELFKPFLMRKLLDRQFARSPRMAKRLVERRDPVIWDLLAEVLFERVVLLNRAPTLHRLSIQAFVPRLVEGQAIQLHPMVCSAFNADFDGDQMAVHVPLSQAAQDEARRLVLSTHNLRHPASGEPVIAPSQDIVLGCFYLTADRPSTRQGTYLFATQEEAVLALSAGHIDLHTPLVVRIGEQPVYETPSTVPERAPRGRVTTTVGRLLFNKILPEPLRYRNYPMSKAQLKSLVAECLARCGEATTVSLLDAMKRLGYQYATKSGMSLATSDITIPTTRAKLIARGQQREEEIDASARRGEMTTEEWSRQVIELWSQVTDEISQEAQAALDPNGPIMTIVQSGATKASFQQIRQLSGIRGLMANPSGKIIPFPVLSNYKLGLRPWELFIAASGARKGFMDRSLNTAMSGYLTRRLVEAGMEVIVTQHDCQASEGLLITQEEMLENDRSMLRAQVTGRVLAESAGPFQAGTLLDAQHADALLKDGVTSLRIRSPLSCQAPYGVCQCCYGADLATGSLVELGTAVGVIAGQAIGEPGTQLTMRTFHSGGIAQNTADITLGLPRVIDLFEVRSPAQAAPFAEREGIVAHIETDSTTGAHRIRCVYRACEAQKARTYTVPAGQVLTVREGQAITRGMLFSEGPCDPHAILLQLGMETAQRYLIQEVQRVYQGVGAIIHDKHLEVIVRQMSRYVQVSASGETDLLPGDIVDRFVFQERVTHSLAQGGNPARARPLLLGLTKTVLQTASWIAAASFQDTARVLARAAIRGQQDALIGLKERLVIGKRIPTRGSYEETR
jgi:DNA-directed RNA polymerase subunit beta'